MNNSFNGQEKFQQLRAARARSGRERSASPRSPTSRGNSQLYRWPTTSIPPKSSEPSAQSLERRNDLHPTLSQAVEAYSHGEISHTRALRKGVAYLEGVESPSDTERDGTFLKFSEALDRTDRRQEELQRGRRGNQTRNESGPEEVGQQGWREKRGGNGKLKISESKCPWYRPEAGGNPAFTDSQRKTRESLEYLKNDIELATRWVKSAPGAPKFFPESEWKNILRGRSVNLGHVLASRPGVSAKFRRIENNLEWHLAWNTTAEAIAFVFPHRRAELDKYAAYVNQKFSSRHPAQMNRVIRFDEAIRGTVGGGETSSLLDREIRECFTESILHPDGVDYWSSANRECRRPQLCNRFNGKAGCSDWYCQYEHRCRRCKQGDHGQANCQKHGLNQERWNRA